MGCQHIHGVLVVRVGNYWTDLRTQFGFWTQPINLGFKFGYFTLDGFKFSKYWLSSWHNIRRCMAHSNLTFVSLVGAHFPCYKPHPDYSAISAPNSLSWLSNSTCKLSLYEAWNLLRTTNIVKSWSRLIWNKFVNSRLACLSWHLMHRRTPIEDWAKHKWSSLASRCHNWRL